MGQNAAGFHIGHTLLIRQLENYAARCAIISEHMNARVIYGD